MKVSDIMSKNVDYVTPDATVKEVARLIFGAGINGVPVCEDKKVVGFITERDILEQFYPSMEEYMQDPVHIGNFEVMEGRITEVLSLTASDIMTKDPLTIRENEPLLRAQSQMFVHKVGRLPVIDTKGNLLGMIAKGDIFQAVVGDKIPFADEEEYHDWLSKHYDLIVDWGGRLKNEIPDIIELLKKEKIEKIVDIGCGTGEHAIALAKEGFHVTGIESSPYMFKKALDKVHKLPLEIANRLRFQNADYPTALADQQSSFGAALFMGNAFSHLATNEKDVLQATVKALLPKKSLIVFQIVNFEKLLKKKGRFQELNFAPSKLGLDYEHAFLEFYDPPRADKNLLTLNMAIFDFTGRKWKYRAMNSTPIVNLTKEKLKALLLREKFTKIHTFGSQVNEHLLKHTFRPLESDWLNVVAYR